MTGKDKKNDGSSRVRLSYLIGFIFIAILILISHLSEISVLNTMKNDAYEINVAGRQRMLSQRLTKLVLQINEIENGLVPDRIVQEYDRTLNDWRAAHEGLRYGDDEQGLSGTRSKEINDLYRDIERYYSSIREAALNIRSHISPSGVADHDAMDQSIAVVLENEQEYLIRMHRIVDAYTMESEYRAYRLRYIQYLLSGVMLLVILIQVFLVFEPTVRLVRRQYAALDQERRALDEARLQAESANRAKSQFLANTSHEIRTPMSAIMGYANMIRAGVSKEDQEEAIMGIKRNGHKLMSVISNILDVAQLEAGRLNLNFERFETRAFFNELAASFSPKAEIKALNFIYQMSSDIPTHLNTDQSRLSQVVLELLDNAVKYTDRGEVRLLIRGLFSASGEPLIQIQVQDTGVGIDDDKREAIFEIFNQSQNKMSREYGGMGMGLTISREIVRLMGGDIAVQPSEEQGSVFTLMIPVDINSSESKKDDDLTDLTA